MSCIPNNLEAAAAPNDGNARRGLFMAIAGLAAIAASYVYAPWSTDGPVLCVFRWVTGLPCPGCGLTRSFCAMAYGHFAAAFRWHVLGPILFMGIVVFGPLLLVQGISRYRFRWVNRLLFSRRIGQALAVVFFGFHLVRLVELAASGMLWVEIKGSALAHAAGWVAGFL